MPKDSCCSLPPKRYRSLHALVPFGRIDRVNPPPSASLLGLGPGLAFRIVVSVSGMCGQLRHIWHCVSSVAHYVAHKTRGCQWKTMEAPGLLIAKQTSNNGVIMDDLDGAGCMWKIKWRRGWDSNPRAGYPTRRFRGAPVTTTSVPLR